MVVKGGEYYSKLRIMIVLIEFPKNKANTSSMQEQKVQRAIKALEAIIY